MLLALVTETKSAPAAETQRSRALLIGTHLAAAVFGYLLGVQGLLPFGSLFGGGTSTPLARVGFVLREQAPRLGPEDLVQLRADVEAVRSSFQGEREVFELVSALRGLDRSGETDWTRAAALCQALKWPRCDRPALEELRTRSRR